jgi:hypothetical protein
MPSHAGPNTSSESNIVFSYDIGDTSNSYRGEPTTNMWGIESGTNVNNRSSWSMPYAYNGAITDSVYLLGTWNGNRIWEVLHTAGTSGYAGFDSWRLCVNQPTAGNTIYNTTRRVAIKICILEGSITDLALHTGGGNGGHDGSNWTPIPESQVPRDCPRKTGWYQFLADGSWASNSVGHCVGLAFISYNRVRILTTEPMYYPSNKLIPFTGYQRSATQGLLPLISNTSINLSSVSFNSNAQIVYDGTDDRIDLGNLGTIGTTYTIECIFNSSAVTSYRNIFDMNYETYNPTTGNVGPRLEQTSGAGINMLWSGVTNNNSLYNSTTPIPISANTNYHMVFTQDGSNGSIYLNGVYRNQAANTQGYIQTFADANLGRGFSLAGDRYFIGTLPVFKIYNTSLSANQVKQNYQQYKTRFNLS